MCTRFPSTPKALGERKKMTNYEKTVQLNETIDKTIKENLEIIVSNETKESRKAGKNMFICPICGSGTGKNGTGAFHIHHVNGEPRYKCHACGKHGDSLQLIMDIHECDIVEARKYCCSVLGISADTSHIPLGRALERGYEILQESHKNAIQSRTEPVKDIISNNNPAPMPNIDSAAAALYNAENSDALNYAHGRGWTDETLKALKIGCYAPNGYKKLLFPCEDGSGNVGYVLRAISEKDSIRYQNRAGVAVMPFLAIHPDSKDFVFIVEGAADSVSIYQAGFSSVAVCGAGETESLRRYLQSIKDIFKSRYIIIPDNDNAGEQGKEKYSSVLENFGVAYTVHNLPTELDGLKIKDCNDILTGKGLAVLVSELQLAIREAMWKVTTADASVETLSGNNLQDAAQNTAERGIGQSQSETDIEILEKIQKSTLSDRLDSILDKIVNPENRPYSTGINGLDEILNGGIHKGELTFFGASPSMGKTTLAMQILERILQDNPEVDGLVFSLEMSAGQHVQKDLSRLSFFHATEHGEPEGVELQKFSHSDLQRQWKQPLSKEQESELEIVKNIYRNYADRIKMFDMESNSVEYMLEICRNYTRLTGRTPIILVDYLQLMTEKDAQCREKLIADVIKDGVKGLQEVVKDTAAACLCVVAFNRESTKTDGTKLSIFAGRDTSSIEFGADTYIGLNFSQYESDRKQYFRESKDRDGKSTGKTRILIDSIELKKKKPREITLVVLKNRMGETGSVDMLYYSAYNAFVEREQESAGLTVGLSGLGDKKIRQKEVF